MFQTPTHFGSIHSQDCARQPRWLEYNVAAEHDIAQGCISQSNSGMTSPDPELQVGVLLSCSMVEHHAGADHKGVLKQQRVRHTFLAAVNGLVTSLPRTQVLQAKQRHCLMKPASTKR